MTDRSLKKRRGRTFDPMRKPFNNYVRASARTQKQNSSIILVFNVYRYVTQLSQCDFAYVTNLSQSIIFSKKENAGRKGTNKRRRRP